MPKANLPGEFVLYLIKDKPSQLKKIDISARAKSIEKKEVMLGNGKRIIFTSSREAARFKAETNRYLTNVLVALNETYISIWTEYRRFWYTASNVHTGRKANWLGLDMNVRRALERADFQLQKFAFRSGGDPYFSFIDLRKITNDLQEAATLLAQYFKHRDHTANYYVCDLLGQRCTSIRSRMERYDYEGTSKKIPGVNTPGLLKPSNKKLR